MYYTYINKLSIKSQYVMDRELNNAVISPRPEK